MSEFVPPDFIVPVSLETADFRLRALTVADAPMDYEAVMESATRLRAFSPNGWPRAGFTLAENEADLVRHQQEFEARHAFAYTVVDLEETRTLGCVYINPSSAPADADVYMWTRDSEHRAGLTPLLHAAVRAWLETKWPFDDVRFTRTDYLRP